MKVESLAIHFSWHSCVGAEPLKLVCKRISEWCNLFAHKTSNYAKKDVTVQRNVLLVLVGHREDAAVNVQKILTGWGCYVKTRLGLHQGTLDECTDKGLIFCELVGPTDKAEELCRKLELLKGVHAQLVSMKLEDDED